MIGVISIIIFLLIILIFILYIIKKEYTVTRNKKEQIKMSFKEAMDLVGLPVITFCNRNVKLNFLLDTGSDKSYINKSFLSFLEYSNIRKVTKNIISAGGNKSAKECCELLVTYKNQKFTDVFYIYDLDEPFAQIKKETGVQIHGILGNGFFEKYKYILDFKSLTAYSNK